MTIADRLVGKFFAEACRICNGDADYRVGQVLAVQPDGEDVLLLIRYQFSDADEFVCLGPRMVGWKFFADEAKAEAYADQWPESAWAKRRSYERLIAQEEATRIRHERYIAEAWEAQYARMERAKKNALDAARTSGGSP